MAKHICISGHIQYLLPEFPEKTAVIQGQVVDQSMHVLMEQIGSDAFCCSVCKYIDIFCRLEIAGDIFFVIEKLRKFSSGIFV